MLKNKDLPFLMDSDVAHKKRDESLKKRVEMASKPLYIRGCVVWKLLKRSVEQKTVGRV